VRVTTAANVPTELLLRGQPEDECTVTDPSGRARRILGFGAPGELRVRYASAVEGEHHFQSAAGEEGVLEVRPYEGANPLFRHGPLRVDASGRHFAHADGTPFLWLGDTWWLGFVGRLGWPDEFQRLTADRVEKGFSVIQIVAGLYPEMPPFDSRGGAEWAWTAGFERLNPGWWDAADLRLAWLVRQGIVPCIVGAWGYYMLFSGIDTMTRHWREVIARWASWPVVFCLAGEAKLPYYPDIFGERAGEISGRLREEWAEVGARVRALDPYDRLWSVHPSPGDASFSSWDLFGAHPELFDFAMLQTGHWDKQSFETSLETLARDVAREPPKPVLNSEVCYEGILGSNWHDTQRFLVWTHLLGGAAGHTYGAQGLWAMNDGSFVGEAGAWSSQTWEDAHRLPGSRHVGIAKRELERHRWWQFEPHPEWVEPHASPTDRLLPYAAGIPDAVRVVYFPSAAVLVNPPGGVSLALREIRLRDLGRGWSAHYLDPRTGSPLPELEVDPDDAGTWTIGPGFLNANPSMEDWVLVLERRP
jgi:uncharacterized protein DUF4038